MLTKEFAGQLLRVYKIRSLEYRAVVTILKLYTKLEEAEAELQRLVETKE